MGEIKDKREIKERKNGNENTGDTGLFHHQNTSFQKGSFHTS
jgi:hypothetical protein